MQLQTYYDVKTLELLNSLHIILLEILNVSKEISVCLYIILPLAAYANQFPEMCEKTQVQEVALIQKILHANAVMGGLEESCLLYAGHWIISLMKIGMIKDADLQTILILLQ